MRNILEARKNEVEIKCEGEQAWDQEKRTADDDKRQHLRGDHCDWHNRHSRFQGRVGFRMLNRVPGLVGRDTKSSYRWRVINVARKAKLLLCRIVVIAEEIVCLHNIDIVYLRGLQNLACAFRAGDARARPDFTPTI